MIKAYAKELIASDPVFRDIADGKETLWINDKYLPFDATDGLRQLVVSDADIADAEERLRRFAPFIRRRFPETAPDNGRIDSPLREIGRMRESLGQTYETQIPGRLFLKMDSHLAIAGSIKARGGIYEVLKHAEDLALAAGLVTEEDDYARFADDDVQAFLGDYTVQVGSTGNLGLSIGIMGASLGFKVRVHMSADARQWKKDLLRAKGVEVIEYADDYSKAVLEGRRSASLYPASYFVDDEYSGPLFLGYAAAAGMLDRQLRKKGITVDARHPLLVYIPCGVGSAPGGVCCGLKRLYADHVHVFFCEPTLFPSVLLGMATDRYDGVNVRDFGLSGMSAADGLACMRMLEETEDVFIEPSSCAAFNGPVGLLKFEAGRTYCVSHGLDESTLASSTQICWATGGSLVPDAIRDEYRNTYL